jgi:hypothetical protein
VIASRRIAHRGEIGTRTEMPARAAKHRNAQRIIGFKVLERGE